MPAGSPIRAGNVRGRLKAPLPAFAVPLPSMIEPSQFTVTLRENVAIQNLLSVGTSLLSLCRYGELDENARDAEREPDEQDPVLAWRRVHRIGQPDVCAGAGVDRDAVAPQRECAEHAR